VAPVEGCGCIILCIDNNGEGRDLSSESPNSCIEEQARANSPSTMALSGCQPAESASK